METLARELSSLRVLLDHKDLLEVPVSKARLERRDLMVPGDSQVPREHPEWMERRDQRAVKENE